MPKNIESLNTELEGFLKAQGFKPKSYDSSGDSVPIADKAEAIQFRFVQNGIDYGPATASIDGQGRLTLYFDQDVFKNSDGKLDDSGAAGNKSWFDFISALKQWAMPRRLTWAVEPIDDLESDMAKRAYLKKEGLAESYHPMGKKASYNDAIPECKIIIKHSKVMEEGEQRFRNVERIFIENAQGERFLAPTTRPGIARVYARHIAEGGLPHDDRWNHIGSLVEDYTKMAGFVRATRNGQFNESAQKLVTEGVNHYFSLRESLHKLSGHKGYNAYFESWTPPLMEDEVTEDLTSMFMSSSLDPRIESVMPILGKLNKHLSETTMNEVSALEEWADNMLTFENNDDDYKDPEEADYGPEYQKTAQNAAAAVKRIEKKLGKVDIAALAKKLNAKEEPKESLGSEQRKAGQMGPTDKVSTGPILGNKPQTQKNLRGKLVAESSDPLSLIKRLSGFKE